MEVIENFLLMEAARDTASLGNWTIVYKDSPQQSNLTVFVCMNARQLSDQTTFKFHLNISSTRRQIEAELVNSKLL